MKKTQIPFKKLKHLLSNFDPKHFFFFLCFQNVEKVITEIVLANAKVSASIVNDVYR